MHGACELISGMLTSWLLLLRISFLNRIMMITVYEVITALHTSGLWLSLLCWSQETSGCCQKVRKSMKRGLSLEENREKMLQIFYDSQDFYLLKELEKLCPRKGVISQSFKDVVQSLVDDDLVSKDKIGTSVYFGVFPS
ncbi:putative mnd1, HTH domain-containing protein [Helianthus annuus]|nr:putative mnd1, HTH domain-containing protein [Helianthus annuus]